MTRKIMKIIGEINNKIVLMGKLTKVNERISLSNYFFIIILT